MCSNLMIVVVEEPTGPRSRRSWCRATMEPLQSLLNTAFSGRSGQMVGRWREDGVRQACGTCQIRLVIDRPPHAVIDSSRPVPLSAFSRRGPDARSWQLLPCRSRAHECNIPGPVGCSSSTWRRQPCATEPAKVLVVPICTQTASCANERDLLPTLYGAWYHATGCCTAIALAGSLQDSRLHLEICRSP